MAPRSRHTLTQAEARYRALVSELKMLTMAFPHLRETVADDDLPVSFLLRRGADRARAADAKTRPRAVTRGTAKRRRPATPKK